MTKGQKKYILAHLWAIKNATRRGLVPMLVHVHLVQKAVKEIKGTKDKGMDDEDTKPRV